MGEYFARQESFIGSEKQQKLSSAKVTVVGCGSLGSFVISALVRSGIGFIRIIDRDVVEEVNLYANETFEYPDIGKPKVVAMKERMKAARPDSNIEEHAENLDYENVELLSGSDIVVDCTDNMAVRYLTNGHCVKNGIPWIYGSVLGDEGYVMPVKPEGKPCFRCLFGDDKRAGATCEMEGVLSPIIFIVSSLQVYEVLKHFTGIGKSLFGQMIHVKLGEKESEIINIKPNPSCKTCALRSFPCLSKMDYTTISICGKNSFQLKPKCKYNIDFGDISRKLNEDKISSENVKDMMIRIVHEDMKASLFKNGTAIIKSDYQSKAKELYERILKVLGDC